MQLFAALGCTAALALSEQPEALRQLAPALLVLAALDLVLLWPAALVSRPEREARCLGPAVLAHASALLPAVAVCARAATYPLVSLLLAAASLLVLAIVARALARVRRLPPRLLVLLLSLACLLPPTWGALRLVADASWPPAAWGPLAWPALLLTHAPGESRQRTASRTQPSLEATPTGGPPSPPTISSPSAGVHRRGVPSPLQVRLEAAAARARETVVETRSETVRYRAVVPARSPRPSAIELPVLGFDARPRLALTGAASVPIEPWVRAERGSPWTLEIDPAASSPQARTDGPQPTVRTPYRNWRLGELRAFDRVRGLDDPALAGGLAALAPWLSGARPPRLGALAPDRYRALGPSRLPAALRYRVLAFALGALGLGALALLVPGRSPLAIAAAVNVFAAVGAGWASPRAELIVTRQTVLRARLDSPFAAAEHLLTLEAPLRRTEARLAWPGSAGVLEPVLYRLGGGTSWTIEVALDGEYRLSGLPVARGGRRLLRSFAPRRLAGPLTWLPAEADAPPALLNRTGLDFVRCARLSRAGAIALGALPDGETLPLPQDGSPRAPHEVLGTQLAALVDTLVREAPGLWRRGIVVLVAATSGEAGRCEGFVVDRPTVLLLPLPETAGAR